MVFLKQSDLSQSSPRTQSIENNEISSCGSFSIAPEVRLAFSWSKDTAPREFIK
jgi:hypothetical protein